MAVVQLLDECLLAVFDRLDSLRDLFSCYKVCIKWSHLIVVRTKKVKYLIEGCPVDPIHYFDCVYYRKKETIDWPVMRTLFGNLTVLQLTRETFEKSNIEDIVQLVVNNLDSLKGLMYHCDDYSVSESLKRIVRLYNKIELVSIGSYTKRVFQNGTHVRQLQLGAYSILATFTCYADDLPNIERLSMLNHEVRAIVDYEGPVLEKMKIVEFNYYPGGSTNDARQCFQFIDSCPNLQSAYIVVGFNHLFVDETIKHRYLQDLVLYFYHESAFCWDELERLLMKYPNLKHLALRYAMFVRDDCIEQLIEMLPNLVLLDVRSCPGVSQRAANYIQEYCEQNERSIKIYFEGNQHLIRSEWPHLSTKVERISRGFDFMKHCFLKSFRDLPSFLIPND